MNPTVCTHKNNPNFWIFGLFFFLYFFIMATCFPFLPIWLSDVIGLNKTETGLVFSSLSLFAICFQPVLGVISDKLGLKKHLMWIVTVLLVLIAPFFLYVFAPLLKTNIWLGALSGGAYIGFVFSAGAGAMEAYIERVSRNSGLNTARRAPLAVWDGRCARPPPECCSALIPNGYSGWGRPPRCCWWYWWPSPNRRPVSPRR